jgi:hypothetical protein
MGNAGIEAKRLHDIAALLRAPGDAHHAAALQPRDLTGNLPNTAGRRRDHDGLARLRFTL